MKKVLIGIGVLVVLVIGAALIAPGFVDWTPYRERVAAVVSDATGREVVIAGPIDMRILPSPRLSAADVRIGNIEGADNPEFMRVGSLDLDISLAPLLSGRIQVERFSLIEPVIALEVLPDGRRSWDFGGRDMPGSVALEDVRVQRGRLTYTDSLNGVSESVSDISGRLSAESLRGPFVADGRLAWRGAGFDFDLNTGRPGANGSFPFRLTLGLAGLAAEASLSGVYLGVNDPGVQGEIRANASDLATMLQASGLAENPPAPTAQPFEARGTVDIRRGRTHVTGVVAQLGDMRLEGALQAEPGEARRFDLDARVNRIDLEGWDEGADAIGGLSIEGLRTFTRGFADWTGDIDLTADAINFRGRIIRQGRLTASVADGVAALSDAGALFPGGGDISMTGDVALAAESGETRLDVEASASNLRAILGWLGHDLVGRVPADRLRHFQSRFTVAGTSSDFRITGLTGQLDTTVFEGAASVRQGQRTGVGLRLALDRINVDAYLPEAWWDNGPLDTVAGDVAEEAFAGDPGEGLFDPGLSAALAEALGQFDANLDLTADGVTLAGHSIAGLAIDAGWIDDTLTLRQATIEDVDGYAIDLQGETEGLRPVRRADLAFDFEGEGVHGLFPLLNAGPVPDLSAMRPGSLSGRIRGTAETIDFDAVVVGEAGRVEAGGSVSGLNSARSFDITSRFTLDTAAPLFSILGLTSTARPVPVSGPVDFYAELAGGAEAYEVRNLQGTLGGVSVRGSLDVERRDERPAISGQVQTGRLAFEPFSVADDDPLTVPFSATAGGGGSVWPRRDKDLNWLDWANLDIAVTASGLTVSGVEIRDPAFEVQVDSGDLERITLDGLFAGGRIGLNGSIDRGGDQPAYALDATLVGAEPVHWPVADWPFQVSGGMADWDVALEADGASEAAMAASLTGEGEFTWREGRVEGLDFAAMIEELDSLDADSVSDADVDDLSSRLAAAGFGGASDVTGIDARFAIESGVLSAEELILQSDLGRLEAAGSVDLPRRSAEMAGALVLTGWRAAPPLAMTLTGPLGQPEIVLDGAALGRYLVETRTPSPGPASEADQQPEPGPTPEPPNPDATPALQDGEAVAPESGEAAIEPVPEPEPAAPADEESDVEDAGRGPETAPASPTVRGIGPAPTAGAPDPEADSAGGMPALDTLEALDPDAADGVVRGILDRLRSRD